MGHKQHWARYTGDSCRMSLAVCSWNSPAIRWKFPIDASEDGLSGLFFQVQFNEDTTNLKFKSLRQSNELFALLSPEWFSPCVSIDRTKKNKLILQCLMATGEWTLPSMPPSISTWTWCTRRCSSRTLQRPCAELSVWPTSALSRRQPERWLSYLDLTPTALICILCPGQQGCSERCALSTELCVWARRAGASCSIKMLPSASHSVQFI